MSKIIKKQIRRSLPLFVIISLVISTSAIGLVFDFDIKLLNIVRDESAFDMQIPAANADNNNAASTTVEVRNAPPTFGGTGFAAEVPASTALAPVNQGEAISFTATGDDPESAQYYLIVCSSNSVSATNGSEGGVPTCGDDLFCISDLTDDEVAATCTYDNVTSATEETSWYAFVCDTHDSQAECSNSNQGNVGVEDAASPMYVNHAPTLNSVATTDDFKEPGGTFTFSATSTDTDVARVDDILTLYICDNGGYATSTGCLGTEFCTATGTEAISCQWTDTAPTVDTAYTYYAYVEDEFYMPAAYNGTTSTYTIINVAPTVDGVYLVPTTLTYIQPNIKEATQDVVITASTTDNNVYDANGCTDIDTATATIYWSSVQDGPYCAADPNNCYQMSTASCSIDDCTGDSDGYATITCTTTIAYHAIPTDPSSFFATTTWYAAIRAFDEAVSGMGTTTVGTDVKTVEALNVEETLIDYGIIRSGQNSGTSTATTTVVNYGNCPIDTQLYGEDMTQGANTIPIIYQKHDLLAYFDYDTQGTAATSSPAYNLVDIAADRPTSSSDVSDYIYWGIGIPGGTLSGIYSGTNTFTAVFDGDGVW